jgi:ABC-type dipeptide/oligopeptide/nickel transport system permease component
MNAAIPVESRASDVGCVRTHSKAGLVSLLIALLFPLLMCSILLIVLVLQLQIENEAFTYFLMVLSGSIAAIIAHLSGLIMGVVGVRNKQRKKLLSVLGIIFNTLPLLLAVVICLLFVAFLIHPFPLGPK